MDTTNYTGNDNYGRPKSDYVKSLETMMDEDLQDEAESKIYMSAFCSNNPRADWHWQVDAIYDECERRGKPEIYKRAYKAVEAGAE